MDIANLDRHSPASHCSTAHFSAAHALSSGALRSESRLRSDEPAERTGCATLRPHELGLARKRRRESCSAKEAPGAYETTLQNPGRHRWCVVALGVLALALAMSHTSPCGPSPPLPAGATPMKADRTSLLRLTRMSSGCEDIPKPIAQDDEILVRVHAASVNPLDWHYLEGTPTWCAWMAGFGKPENPRLGVDFSGTVEAVGKNVTHFKPGDEVFGGKFGALAEYVAVREERAVALKPANVSHEQAAAVAIAGITALQGLRDKGHIHAGQNVLVNGASGGVGTFAVQIAKSFGANVTGVCSTQNVELVRSIGADHVIDYTREDFTKGHSVTS